MSTQVAYKIRKPAREHKSDKGSTFFLTLSESNYDYKKKEKVWTNYSAGIYAGTDKQADFYRNNLIEGAVVHVSCMGLIVDCSFTGDDGVMRPVLEMVKPELNLVSSPVEYESFQSEMGNRPQAPSAPQAHPMPSGGGFIDDDIPFAPVDSRSL